jgi:hypothetical protein
VLSCLDGALVRGNATLQAVAASTVLEAAAAYAALNETAVCRNTHAVHCVLMLRGGGQLAAELAKSLGPEGMLRRDASALPGAACPQYRGGDLTVAQSCSSWPSRCRWYSEKRRPHWQPCPCQPSVRCPQSPHSAASLTSVAAGEVVPLLLRAPADAFAALAKFKDDRLYVQYGAKVRAGRG